MGDSAEWTYELSQRLEGRPWTRSGSTSRRLVTRASGEDALGWGFGVALNAGWVGHRSGSPMRQLLVLASAGHLRSEEPSWGHGQKFGARWGHAARSQMSIGSSDRTETSTEQGRSGERVTGIEPACPAWEAGALPLSYTRDEENTLSSVGHGSL